MYFLIGLGIILAIVYGNMLLDYLKERRKNKAKETDGVSPAAGQREQAEPLSVCENGVPTLYGGSLAGDIPYLAALITEKLKQNQNIFGLPLRFCESDGQGKLITVDREDNIYIIETGLRPEYEALYQQALDDMAAEKKRIAGRNADDRRVYVIICTNSATDDLRMVAEKKKNIRIFQYDIDFRNIM